MPPAASTFSSDTKDALAHDIPAVPHCRAALLHGLLLYGATNGKDGAIFRTRRLAVARLVRTLLGEYGESGEYPIRKHPSSHPHAVPTYEIALPNTLPDNPKPTARCDRRTEMRAAFLSCGSLANPQRGYHLEFLPPAAAQERLAALLRAEGCAPKTAPRRGRSILYLKDIEAIAHFLSAVGAFNAVLLLENERAVKETKNRIRRLVNTEAANVDRAVDAAAHQRETIAFLNDAYGLHNLSAPLREIARLRLAHPTDSIAELARRCDPPTSKSTAGNRLATLSKLAERLRTGRGSQEGEGSEEGAG